MTQADRVQLAVRRRDLVDRGALSAGDQEQQRAVGVGERMDGVGIDGLLLLETGQRPEAGRVALALLEEAGPRAGQLEEAQRVTGGCGVEDDVVVAVGHRGVGQQRGELVERRDLRGAGARELFLDGADVRVGEQAAHRAHDPLAVGHGSLLGVDLECGQPGHTGHLRHCRPDRDTEHLPDVRGGVGADQQHTSAACGQRQCGRARDRGLAHPALAGEEQEPRCAFEERRRGHHQQPPPPQHLPSSRASDAVASTSGSSVTTAGAAVAVPGPAHARSSSRVG